MGPELVQHPLSRADGSAVLSTDLYAVVAGVHGPIEVQRRDELPEEAAIEVNLRPASGVGGPRERWLEGILQSVLKSVALVHMHPRTLIQITLQITKQPTLKLKRTAEDISVLPTLLNASLIALMDGALPLATTSSATLAVVTEKGDIVLEPGEKEVARCKSIHAMAFNAHGEQILDQSSGTFDLDVWEKVLDAAQRACLSAMAPLGEDAAMANGDQATEPWLRQTLQGRVRAASAWREAT